MIELCHTEWWQAGRMQELLGIKPQMSDGYVTVSEQVCENDIENRQINTFKCLVNGEISLSWNTNNVIEL